MKNGKRPKLPRGLRWKSDSPFIWFSWRDARGKQHQKNTETTDPAKALGTKLESLASAQQEIEQIKTQSEDMGKLPLSRVADVYFEWKAASSAAVTIERERRIFNSVRKFFGSQLPVKAISLPMIQQYQQQRRQQVSKTMKQPVTARSVNYEMQLLCNMLKFAHSWTADLEAGYKPLRQVKSRVGKCAAQRTGDENYRDRQGERVLAGGHVVRCGSDRHRLPWRRDSSAAARGIDLENGKLVIRREIAQNRKRREPRLMALAQWGLRHLLERAHALGASE